MQFKSVWAENTAEYPRLSGDIARDTVIIGGGIAGYLTAFRLAEAGKKVTLIEADRLFSGTTGKTTAKITSNQGGVYSDLHVRYGKETAQIYYEAQKEGMRLFRELIERYGIVCDFTPAEGYIFSRGSSLENLSSVMRGIGSDCEFVNNISFLNAQSAVKEEEQYLFDPIKFLRALPANFEIFEHTRAVDIDTSKRIIYTENGSIRAGIIIVATHFPIINSHGLYFMKLRQSTSYTVAVNKKITENLYLDIVDNGLSVRPYADGTILGGADHRTGRVQGSGFEYLYNEVQRLGLSRNDITNIWCAEDVMTFDGMPMAGKYSRKLKHIYVLTGFNKWGMANSMICAGIIRDLILGKPNRYSDIFSPQRKIKGGFGDFMSNACTNVKEIFLGYFRITGRSVKSIEKGTGAIVKYHGKKRAVYRAEDGKLYVIGSMCPHLHGELKWNAQTRTWDCPCHGSRFDIRGNVLSEPSAKHCKCYTAEENSPE